MDPISRIPVKKKKANTDQPLSLGKSAEVGSTSPLQIRPSILVLLINDAAVQRHVTNRYLARQASLDTEAEGQGAEKEKEAEAVSPCTLNPKP